MDSITYQIYHSEHNILLHLQTLKLHIINVLSTYIKILLSLLWKHGVTLQIVRLFVYYLYEDYDVYFLRYFH